jgi:thioredoxin 2
MMAPAYEAAARELEPDVALIKLNSEKEPAIAAELGIRSIPTTILFRNGRELARQSGAMSSGQIVRWVRDQLRLAAA